MDNEEPRDDEHTPDEEGSAGVDELLYSLGEALRAKQSKEAIAKLIDRYAENIKNRVDSQRRVIYVWYALTVVLIGIIGVLGYFKVLNSETTGTLIGAIVGGLYQSTRR